MKYFCIDSLKLFPRVLGGAAVLFAIVNLSSSVFPQAQIVLTGIQHQESIEKNLASKFRVPSRQQTDQPDSVSLRNSSVALMDVATSTPGFSAKSVAAMNANQHFTPGDAASPILESRNPPEGGVIANGESKFVQPANQEHLDESWRPFEGLPRQRRFNAAQTNEVADDPPKMPSEKFHWKDAMYQSMLIQGLQHGYALVGQAKTRRALKGPFFQDYIDSIKGLKGWSDGGKFFTNYIAHPMQGAMTGFIFLQNHDRMKKQKFGESKQYWKDRFKAFVWSTAWSTNWELGPISQSSIGNVGLYDKQGYVDLVMTPTAGTGWMIVEEAFDRYIIRHIEERSFIVKVLARMILNPMRSVANALRFKTPWYRDRPFGD